jgi:hypothetical protein
VSDPLDRVSPQEAQLVWKLQCCPSARSVAKALNQAGRQVHFTTVARWRREGLLVGASPKHQSLDGAADQAGSQAQGSKLPSPLTAQEAKREWDAQRCPSSRSVARALTRAGRPIHFTTIARWKRQGWGALTASEHPLTKAMTALDLALPLLTGDPTSKAADILRGIESRGQNKTDGIPRIFREACLISIVLSKELSLYHPELVVQRPVHSAVLLNALSELMKASSQAYLHWFDLQRASEVER